MPNESNKTTILFLAANPVDTDSLRLGEELKDIKKALRQATYHHLFDLQDEWAVGIEELRRAMLRYRNSPIIVHFAGHGGEGSIYLEGRDGLKKPVEATALSRFLGRFLNIQCVILNACYSEELAKALAEVVPCVIGMEAAVTNTHAILFAVALYDSIGEGLTFEEAFGIAESTVDLEGALDAVRPVYRSGRVAVASMAGTGDGGARLTGTGDGSTLNVATGSQVPNDKHLNFLHLVVHRVTELTGKQQGELTDALVDAFGDEEALGQMVAVQLNQKLNVIAGGNTFSAIAFHLVEWALRSGYLTELIQGALDAQPRNQKLRKFALSVGATEAVN